MAEFKLGYKHYPKDLAKFKPVDKDDDLTNLRFGNNTLIEIVVCPHFLVPKR